MFRLAKALIPAAFAIAVLLAFGHSLFQGFAPIDDIFLVVENPAIRGFTLENLKHVFSTYDPELYIPLIFASFQFDYTLWGLNPFGFHLTNLILHAVNSMLVYLVLFKLTDKKLLSFFAGLIFAVHPLNTEAAVWIAGRKDLLSALFFLLAVIMYLETFEKGTEATEATEATEDPDDNNLLNPRFPRFLRLPYTLSIFLFLLALLSKITAVTLFGVIVLHHLLFKRRSSSSVSSVPSVPSVALLLRFVPYALLSVIFMAVAMGGKGRVIAAVGVWDKILVAFKSTGFYIQKFLWPSDLTVIYPLQGDISFWSAKIFPFLVLFAILVYAAAKSAKRRPEVTFGIASYIAMLSPTFLNIGKAGLVFFAVDRYAYLPMVAILFLGVSFLGRIKLNRVYAITAGGFLLIVLVIVSRFQTGVWDTPDGVYRRALSIYPESIGARVGLAAILRHQNKLAEAFEVLKEGLRYGNHELLELNAGYVYAKAGQVSEAQARFNAAQKMNPENPEAYFALGSLYEQTGKKDKAIPEYEKAVELDDSYVIARAKLGHLYLEEGRTEEARAQFEKALEWNEYSVEAREGMTKLNSLRPPAADYGRQEAESGK